MGAAAEREQRENDEEERGALGELTLRVTSSRGESVCAEDHIEGYFPQNNQLN